jgi:hypothetical protein
MRIDGLTIDPLLVLDDIICHRIDERRAPGPQYPEALDAGTGRVLREP